MSTDEEWSVGWLSCKGVQGRRRVLLKSAAWLRLDCGRPVSTASRQLASRPSSNQSATTSLPAVDLSAMPGGATPLLDDAFMQEVSDGGACFAGGCGSAQGFSHPTAQLALEARGVVWGRHACSLAHAD